MTDNIAITPGSGTTVRTDNIGGAHVQRVKLMWGADGTALDVNSIDPLPVQMDAVQLEGESHIGEVGGSTGIVTPTITMSTTAYAANDIIGGEVVLLNAFRSGIGAKTTGVAQSLTVLDLEDRKPALNVLVFNANPVGTYTDNAAFSLNASDYNKVLGVISVATADYRDLGTVSVATPAFQPFCVWGNGISDLYVVIVLTGTPPAAWTATSSLRLTFGILRD
jgi:hypothetical protein